MACHGEKRSSAKRDGFDRSQKAKFPVRWQRAQRAYRARLRQRDTWVELDSLENKGPMCHRHLELTGLESQRDTWSSHRLMGGHRAKGPVG